MDERCVCSISFCRTAEIQTMLWKSGIVIRSAEFESSALLLFILWQDPRKLQKGAISLPMRVNMNSLTGWSFVGINLAKLLTGKNQLTVMVSLKTFGSQSTETYGKYAICSVKHCVSAWIIDACICSTNSGVYFTNSSSL